METQNLVLYGAGGMGREVVKLVERINAVKYTYNFKGFVDDNEKLWGEYFNGNQVLGGFEWLRAHKEELVCCCSVGFPIIRRLICQKLSKSEITQISLIDPDVMIDESTSIGLGTIISQKCGISVNVKIGNGVFFNSDVGIGHDSIVEDFVVCHPRVQISGGCVIGEAASIGSVSFLNHGVKVGNEAVVAPLSAVYGKVKAGTHVLGNPAKRIAI